MRSWRWNSHDWICVLIWRDQRAYTLCLIESRKKTAICKSFHQEANRLTLWPWSFHPPELGKISIYCLSHPAYDNCQSSLNKDNPRPQVQYYLISKFYCIRPRDPVPELMLIAAEGLSLAFLGSGTCPPLWCRGRAPRAGVPNLWDLTPDGLWGGADVIMMGIKSTINIMHLKHPQTIPTLSPGPWKKCLPQNWSLVPK